MSTWWKNIADLDADQRKVIALPKDGDHLIVGPAGCGKTNLLLLRATFLIKAGVPDVTILTFGRVLKEFLIAGTTNYDITEDKILTYVQWGAQLLRANGINFNDSGSFAEVRERLLVQLNHLASLAKPINVADCILLDEAQDYSSDEIAVIGLFARQLYAVGDERQRVTGVTGGLEALKQRCGDPVVLQHHYRNGLKICRVADGIRNEIDLEVGMEASSRYNEHDFKSSVEAKGGIALAEQCTAATEEIATQLFAYPDEAIGVLCPKLEDASLVVAALRASKVGDKVQAQLATEGYQAFDPDRPVIVSTILGAKGLEFRAVHLLGMEKLSKFGATQKNLAFTGVTRAKTSLRVYYDTSIPGYFVRGISAVDGAPPIDPPLDDLFAKA